MCRRLLFISMVVVAVSSVALAQPSWPMVGQQTHFVGGGGTYAARSGGLGVAGDGNFETCGQSASLSYAPCNTRMNQSNSAYLDQATAAAGCGGSSAAGQCAIGGGVQRQASGYVPSSNGPTCYPYSSQQQVIGGGSTQNMYATCGNNGASGIQTGGATESQNINTPSTSGGQYQHLSGTQGGMVAGVPTSYASASGLTGGGGTQCQTFGGSY
jgi:hypothetical protein